MDERPAPDRAITILGARQHNLQGIDCSFPKGALTVVTGVSGSGKSSLVMDTLYAEGFRRYTEAMSSYARRFLDQVKRPDVEAVHGIQPAVAFGQRNRARGARSTVGTATEVVDLLRVLLARAGDVVCPDCEVPATAVTPGGGADLALEHFPPGTKLLVVTDRELPRTAAERREHVSGLIRDGHLRWLDGRTVTRLDPARPPRKGPVPLVVDRVTAVPDARARLAEAVEAAFRLGEGRARLLAEDGESSLHLAEGLTCPGCGRTFAPPEPSTLSFNTPLGACPACHGFGRIQAIDEARVIPDEGRSLKDGAVAPFATPAFSECQDDLLRAARRLRISLTTPWRDLSDEQRELIRHGDGGEWYGIDGFFAWLQERRYKMHYRILVARYRRFDPCTTCGGSRLRDEARWVRVGGHSLSELCDMSVEDLQATLFALDLPATREATVRTLLRELRRRVDYLVDVGLGYLTLARQTRTLSGGEAQRINLASALGAALTDTLYVLDEPSIGLHPADMDRLTKILGDLRSLGNTVVVVEHQTRVIRQADHLIDLGPGAGRLGGRLLYEGPPAGLPPDATATGRALAAEERPAPLRAASRPPTGWLRIRGARANNLRGLDLDLPLGVLVAITGVSGSGKSTLLESILHGGLRRLRGEAVEDAGDVDLIEGADAVSSLELIDQSPVARSGRSNPATWLKIFDPIRTLLARTPLARDQGLSPGWFSFNVPGGRCEACQGDGTVEVDLQFLGEAFVPCQVCNGLRFSPEARRIRWRGLDVVAILDLTVDDALTVFQDQAPVRRRLQILVDIGLGYLRLGQPTSTLSAGESQRLKLARHLGAPAAETHGALVLMDEPTTGLHPADVATLMDVLDRLVERGVSLVVVEHDLDVLRRADHLIDLGPGGGEAGGRLVACGTPAEVAAAPGSITGRYLAPRPPSPRGGGPRAR